MTDYKDCIIDAIMKYTSPPHYGSWFSYDSEKGWMYCENVIYAKGPKFSDLLPFRDVYIDSYYLDAYQWNGNFRLTITPDGENHREFFKSIITVDGIDNSEDE